MDVSGGTRAKPSRLTLCNFFDAMNVNRANKAPMKKKNMACETPRPAYIPIYLQVSYCHAAYCDEEHT